MGSPVAYFLYMEILFENEHLLVLNKPAGILVHGDGKSSEPTVADWVLEHFADLRDIGEPMTVQGAGGAIVSIVRPGIVHRLDKDTSGCLVIAKTQESFGNLKSQFQEHTIQKTYHAFVYGVVKQESGRIDAPIGRSAKDFRRYTAGRGKRGTEREAVTLFNTLARFEDGLGDTFSLMSLSPLSGRTHQLRVHMQFLHHPIVSDSLYAPKKAPALGFTRQALHARSIVLTDVDGNRIEVMAPYPDDFKAALSAHVPELLDL